MCVANDTFTAIMPCQRLHDRISVNEPKDLGRLRVHTIDYTWDRIARKKKGAVTLKTLPLDAAKILPSRLRRRVFLYLG